MKIVCRIQYVGPVSDSQTTAYVWFLIVLAINAGSFSKACFDSAMNKLCLYAVPGFISTNERVRCSCLGLCRISRVVGARLVQLL